MSRAGHGKPAIFTLEEVLAIMRAGGRETLADLLAENARRASRLPSGSQLRELRLLVKQRVISSHQARHLLGIEVVRPALTDPAGEAPVRAAAADRFFATIRESIARRRPGQGMLPFGRR